MEQNLHVHVCVCYCDCLLISCACHLHIKLCVHSNSIYHQTGIPSTDGEKNCKKCKHPAKGHMGPCGDKCANAPKSAPPINSSAVNSAVSTGNLTSTPGTQSGSVQNLNTTHATSPGVTQNNSQSSVPVFQPSVSQLVTDSMQTQTDTQTSVSNLPQEAGSVSTQPSVLDYQHITGSIQTGTTQQSDTQSYVGKLTELIGHKCVTLLPLRIRSWLPSTKQVVTMDTSTDPAMQCFSITPFGCYMEFQSTSSPTKLYQLYINSTSTSYNPYTKSCSTRISSYHASAGHVLRQPWQPDTTSVTRQCL